MAQRLLRHVLAPVGVHVHAEPLPERGELAALDLLLEIRHGLERLLPDLHRHHGAEEVRREVAEQAGAPVHILQNAVPVVGHVDAEILVHLFRPALRQVTQLDAAVDDVLLELEAEDDVHAVRHLVRLDADQRRFRLVDSRQEAFELDALERRRERRLDARVEEAPERKAAADEVLPEPALRLVHAERRRRTDRQVRELARDLMLVEPVPVLVHRREERPRGVRVVVGRDADVVDPGAGRERMLGLVDAPRSGAMPEEVDYLVVERDLRVDRKIAGQERVVDLAVAQARDQRHELVADLREDARHLRRLHLRLEVVEQDVVWLVARLIAVDVAHAQLDVALEHGKKQLEVRRGLRLEPHRDRFGRGARHLGAKRGRHAHGLLVVAACDTDRRRVDRIGIERGFDRL